MPLPRKNPDAPVHIYALIDPLDGKPFYVGKTTDPETRLSRHIRDGALDRYHAVSNAKGRRIGAILDAGKKPLMVTLMITTMDEEDRWEGFWISQLVQDGYKLLNSNTVTAGSGQIDQSIRSLLRGRQVEYRDSRGRKKQSMVRWVEEREGILWYELRDADDEERIIWRTQAECRNAPIDFSSFFKETA